MKIVVVIIAALGALSCLHAAELPAAPLAIYYSFDTPVPASSFAAMQTELDRILAPSQLRVVWRSVGNVSPAETFVDLVVLRFRGNCLFDSNAVTPVSPGQTLAETEISDGRILPFGQIECDALRNFIAPVSTSHANRALGRAMARVAAHELYHMLTRSMQHASSGIARAAHSRADLLSSSFHFAKPEQDWLRLWTKHLAPQQAPSSTGVVTLVHDTP